MRLRRNADSLVRDVLRAVPRARLHSSYPEISDLAVIGDRHTAAVIGRDGALLWYCPGRFDSPSLFGGLLDPALAGSWTIEMDGAVPHNRRYLDRSAVLETTLRHPSGHIALTDWMNLGESDVPHGILCRTLSAAPADLRIVLTPRPDYGARIPALRRGTPKRVMIDDRFDVQSSHPVTIKGGAIEIRVCKGERSWVVLSDVASATRIVTSEMLDVWQAATLRRWSGLAALSPYEGPWREQVHASIRALHLLVYEPTGAIAAAATMGLPEVPGGGRNYDYRFSWLRDSGMVVRGVLRFETETETACRHLGVFAALRGAGYRRFMDPVWTVGGERVPMPTKLALAGYKGSRPVLAGNPAARQLQLGSLANLLLGLKEIYDEGKPRFQWELAAETVEFLIENWSRQGHGIWEEKQEQAFTASRVFAVCAIERLIPFSTDSAEQARWREAAQIIRADIEKSSHTPSGAYAAIRGGRGVDITAALYPVWGYCAPDNPALEQTIREIERDYSPRKGLYHRYLQKPSARRREGSFLTGTFWMAEYWTARGDLNRAWQLIETGIGYANDLGLFSEEIDDGTGKMLGNIPQALVHGSFLSAVADYAEALRGGRESSKPKLSVEQEIV